MKQKNGIAGIYLLGALAAQAGNYTVIKKKVPSKDVTP